MKIITCKACEGTGHADPDTYQDYWAFGCRECQGSGTVELEDEE